MTDLGPNPSGLCMCGCGQRTTVNTCDNRAKGWRKGGARRYVKGHRFRKDGPRYIVDLGTGCWVWQHSRDRNGYGRVPQCQAQVAEIRRSTERNVDIAPRYGIHPVHVGQIRAGKVWA